MSLTEATRRIIEHGDILERRFYSDESFRTEFDLYPVAWCLAIPEERASGTIALADKQWSTFAERHYSTIVRCWSAHTAKNEISTAAEAAMDQRSADAFVGMHRLLFDFYCTIGAAIDNLRYTFDAYPVKAIAAFEKLFSRDDIAYSLKWLYERRTQFVHKAIVPCFHENGLISVDAALFDDVETHWGHSRPIKITELSQVTELHWSHFVDEMRSAWSRLIELLKDHKGKSIHEIVFPDPIPTEIVWSSGTPEYPYGWPNFPDVDGSGIREMSDNNGDAREPR